MIDVHHETLIALRDVPGWCQKHLGKRVHISTCHRWGIRGARGVKLETLLCGGQRMTSAEAIQRFFAGITAAADGENQILCADVMDDPAINRAESFLESEGI